MMNRKPLKRLTAIALSMAMTLPGAMPVYAVPEGAERAGDSGPQCAHMSDRESPGYLR